MIDKCRALKYTKSIGLYFSASAIPMVLNLASNPLVAKNMSPVDYAITGYYGSFNTLITPLILFYMMNYYIKSYYQLDEPDRIILKANIFKALIYVSGFISVLCCAGLIGYMKFFNAGSEIPVSPYLYLSVFALPLTGIYTLVLCDYRISRQSRKYFNLSVVNGVIAIAVILLLVVILKGGATGRLLATLLTNAIFFIWSCWYYRDLFRIRFNFSEFRKIVKFCAPLTLAAMLGFFSNGFDRILLEKTGDVSELGYYVVGVQMAGYLTVFSTALSATFQPDIYESIARRNYMTTLKYGALLVGGVIVCVAFFILLAPWLIKILTAGRYMLSLSYTRIIALSAVTSTLYYAISQFTMGIGKTMLTLMNKVISSVLIVAMFVFLIKSHGFVGAAWGIVLSFLIQFLCNAVLLYVCRKMPADA